MRRPRGAERVEGNEIMQNPAETKRARLTQDGVKWVTPRGHFMVRKG